MKMSKKATAAFTALAMIASASVAAFPVNSFLSVPGISAEEVTGYSISLSKETYDINSLKTLAYYKQNELYTADLVNSAVDEGNLDSRNVAEVTLSFDENIGFWGATLVLDFDEELTFAGCSKYMDKENTPVSGFDTMADKYIKIVAQRGRIIINFQQGKNVEETGELFKFLFVLPEKCELNHEYKVGLKDEITGQQIVPWEDGIETTYSSKSGGITLTSNETPGTDNPDLSENIAAVINAGKDNILKPVQAENTVLNEDENINIEIPDVMAFRDDLKQVEFKVNLSDFDASKEGFDTAAFGFNLPEGFSIAEVKPATAACVQILDSTDELVSDYTKYASFVGLTEKSQYIYFSAVDTSGLESNAELFSLVLNVPETGVDFVNDISAVSFYGRITDVSVEEDGKVQPTVSIIKNGGTALYSKLASKLLTGFRGDVDLDNEVGQADANVVLKEVLASDAGKTILPESINMEAAGEDSVKLANFLGDVDVSDNGTMIRQGDANCILKAVLYKDATPDRKMSAEVWEKAIG